MEDYLSAELTATCAVLGYYDGANYHLDKYCLDVIKDLIRYLKRDDDTHTIRRFLGRTKLLQTDLVKILVYHVSNIELWDVLLRYDNTEREEENEMTIERILIFIRNVLQVPANDNDKRTNNDATVHDKILFAYHTSGIVDILLFIVSNQKEQQYHMQVLEIVSLMLREQNASQLAVSGLQRSTAEKEEDETRLVTLLQKELQEKMNKMKKYVGSR
ncbi:Protein timeless-like protein [Harpegnathos saltator]|uniref:Protein timeless-like protein n=1 Tax=Harpegnathos saltator TaxID=610380 RepID=E2C3N8_HARSA|nr:Protein timeless-like protein [Harpegnathos saltator]